MPADLLVDVVDDLSSVPPIDSIDEEVRAGLPGEAERMARARLNEDYYALRNDRHIARRESEDEASFAARPKVTSAMTMQAIAKLTELLYGPGPTRTLSNSPALDAWLQGVYGDVHVSNRFEAADRAATLNDVAAIQVEATGDPRRPIRLWPWQAHELAVFCPDDDPTTPWAVVTCECLRDRRAGHRGMMRTRYRVWTAAERRTYLSAPHANAGVLCGVEAVETVEAESGPSPYPGVLPFTLVRNQPVEATFWDGGIGTPLRKANAAVDQKLSAIAEHLQTFLNPKGFVQNVSADCQFTERVGGFIRLTAMRGAQEGENHLAPSVFYLQPTLAVEQAWLDVTKTADLALEELGLPITAIRDQAATDLSGIAIVVRMMPLLSYTRKRQPRFSEYEVDLAARILAVAGLHYELPEHLRAARDPKLLVVWPQVSFPAPSVERDEGDRWELEQGLADPIEVLARRRGLTLQQAEDLAGEIAARRTRWNALMGVAPGVDPAQQAAEDLETIGPAKGAGPGPEDAPAGAAGDDA
jgi:hypothetical protein